MNLLSKPISSPSRADSFPPPLLSLLRTNGANKSRGRSSRATSSPIFIRKKSGTSSTITTQEPSSPKVTCMGQVRVTRSTKKKKEKKRSSCEWIQNALFCRNFNKRTTPKESKQVSGRWGSFSSPKELEIKAEIEETEEKEDKDEIFIAKTPPKNALLLMRCKSEPYRGSSLENQVWGSPKNKEEGKESKAVIQVEEKLGFCEGLESSTSTEVEAVGVNVVPLGLTRCKSEPVRRFGRFVEESCFWKRRLGFIDASATRF